MRAMELSSRKYFIAFFPRYKHASKYKDQSCNGRSSDLFTRGRFRTICGNLVSFPEHFNWTALPCYKPCAVMNSYILLSQEKSKAMHYLKDKQCHNSSNNPSGQRSGLLEMQNEYEYVSHDLFILNSSLNLETQTKHTNLIQLIQKGTRKRRKEIIKA